jgi:phage tail sheath protein FI
MEPNTVYTRSRVIATLDPIFSKAKNTQGLYEYQIICDGRNNTSSVIDQNEMVVDIYLKPVRTAEFILVNFYATSTGTNFNEIIG